jgi:cytochrome c551/c552
MSSFRERRAARAAIGWLLAAASSVAAAQGAAAPAAAANFPGIGRPATPAELRAWDIDVRPDFKGLPAGSGTVARGMDIWESKCASCHGVFGESNEVFSPLVGGTTKEDIRTGRVARLTDAGFPGRTTMMKLATVSTLWDYIYRAMPWNAPKSLSVDDTYAVTAYLLNLGGVLPDDFTLSDRNIAEVQARLPNRNGMTTDHGMWPGRALGNGGRPDVRGTACMSPCESETKVASFLPDHARNAHGNLAEQNRLVGAQRGADTTRPPAMSLAAASASRGPAAAATAAATPRGAATGQGVSQLALATRLACTACHGVDNKIVGPGFREIARKYAGRADAVDYLAERIKAGGSGVWGAIPMPAQTLGADDARTLARWIADGAAR